jgi:hypothetical protein
MGSCIRGCLQCEASSIFGIILAGVGSDALNVVLLDAIQPEALYTNAHNYGSM